MKNVPRQLALRRSEEKAIARRLSGVPTNMPEVGTAPLDGPGFDVEMLGVPATCFVPLGVGTEGIYADYDAITGELLEANLQQVARRVQVGGMWCTEVYTAGGASIDGDIGVFWRYPTYYRVRPESVSIFDPIWGEFSEPLPRRFKAGSDLSWLDETTASSDMGSAIWRAGFRTLSVGGRSYECMRLLEVCPERLDDIYVARDGRIVCSRAFLSGSPQTDKAGSSRRLVGEWQMGREKLIFNGREYFYWFTTLTNAALDL